MSKIKEIILEPAKIYVGSSFKLKIKATRGVTYQEMKDRLTYNSLLNYKYSELKGD